ncbi:MAG: hypothetical protein IKQ35_00730 [Bacilli bacterium]|nr:hypothetical protein [Bacilli bacterium]
MKKIIGPFAFLIILGLLVELSIFIFIPNKKNLFDFGMYNISKYDILNEKNDSIDVIFLGDSLIYNSISPMYLWNKYGFTSYDCASPATTIEEMYKYSEVIVKSQKPKLVMLEADVLFRVAPKTEGFFEKTKEDISNKVYYVKKLFPLAKYHNNWKQIGKKEMTEGLKGFRYTVRVEKSDKGINQKETKAVASINKENYDYFIKLLNLYRKNDIEFMFIENPTVRFRYDRHNRIKDIATKNNIEVLNLNLIDLGIDWAHDTKDGGVHMNYYGSKKVSNYVGKYIMDKKIVKDHRKDPNYSSWHDAYKQYQTLTLYE